MTETKEQLKEKLDVINTKIKDLTDKVSIKSLDIEEGKLLLKNNLVMLKTSLSGELDELGKKKYSNDDKRDVRIQELLSDSTHPLSLLSQQLKDDERLLELKKNELSFMKRQFEIYNIVSRL